VLTRCELHRHSIVPHTDLAAGDRLVLGDKVQLQQVLLNLIINGIQAMGAVTDCKRELTVSVTRAEPGHVQVAGPGIDPTTAPASLRSSKAKPIGARPWSARR
jgi:signal transduction histidine kinase